jgi:hypothetical protein
LTGVEIFCERRAEASFHPGKVARVQKQIFETSSQIQLALIKHGQNTDEQKRFPLPPLRDTLSPPGRGEGRDYFYPLASA